MAEEILMLAKMQHQVQEFVRDNERGLVTLSLCEVMNVLLQELQSRIAQFEESQCKMGTGLQKFKLYLKPALHTFELLTMVINNANLKGAKLLNTLYTTCQMFGVGDARRSLANHLLKQTMEAYCYLIDQWLNYGQLYDPYQEFFIVETGQQNVPESVTYQIDWDRVPVMLEDIAEKILQTGIYVRILLGSKNRAVSEPNPVHYTTMEELKETIGAIHQIASDNLMKYLVLEKNLMDVFESLHAFFLMARSDYLCNLLAEGQHRNLNEAFSLNFHEALEQSTLRNDPNKHLFSLDIDDKAMPGLRINKCDNLAKIVTMKFRVEWPLHMFVTKSTLENYQTMFKFLLQLKQAERDLSNIWLMHMKWKRLAFTPNAQIRLNFVFVNIQRMLFLCRNVAYLSTIEVTERNFNILMQTYEKHMQNNNANQSVCFVIEQQKNFVEQVVKQSMVNDGIVGPHIHRAISLCILFATQVIAFLDQHQMDNKGQEHDNVEQTTRFASELLHNQGYIAMVTTAATQFDKHLRELVAILEANESVNNSLLLRLNYSGFFY
uniref:Spindle pole body component n=2 Tax=Babesia bovis TaxID=5865 RepID=A7AT27_BABBO|eukprot:XP_001609656.1 spc97 / spc98 family protein [Babesia bovis T2Bo]